MKRQVAWELMGTNVKRVTIPGWVMDVFSTMRGNNGVLLIEHPEAGKSIYLEDERHQYRY